MKHETASNDPTIHVLKTAKTRSLSGESELTYQVGCDSNSGIRFRVIGNSAAGTFHQDWVSLLSLREALAKAPSPQAITSYCLRGLYAGRSANARGFLLAVLKNEGLVVTSKTVRRCHELVDEVSIAAASKAWLAAGDAPKSASAKMAKGKQSVAVTKHVPSEVKKGEPSEAKKGDPPEVTQSEPSGIKQSDRASTTKGVPAKVAPGARSKVTSGVPPKVKQAVPRTGKPKEPPKGKAR